MATYNIFPKTEQDIVAYKLDANKTAQLISAFSFVRSKFPNIETPFALSRDNNFKSVKVLRYICNSLNVKDLKKYAPLFTFTSGDGSRTKKGTASKGVGFEKDLMSYLDLYKEQGLEAIKDNNIRSFISDIVKQYSLDKYNNLIFADEGKSNKKRGVSFIGNQPIIGNSASDFNIGSTITDITIKDGSNPIVYMSLKYDAFSFFNMGIVTSIPEQQVKQGFVQNQQGQALFDLLGINNVNFCKVFKHYKDSGFKEAALVDTNPNYDEAKLKKLLLSGIGYGYHMVHKHKTGGIEHYKMTKSVAESKVNIKSVKIRYPFVSAKVVYVYVMTDIYKFTLMFRNNQSNVYPNVFQGYAEAL